MVEPKIKKGKGSEFRLGELAHARDAALHPKSTPHFDFGLDERGDFAWQARVSLEAQAATAVQHADWDAVSGLAFALIELSGCQEAAATAQWLLLYQSCCARRYLLSILRTATKPTSRLALLLDQLDPNSGAGSSGGGGGNGNEGEEFSVSAQANVLPPMNVTAVEEFGGFLGRPWNHPSVQKAVAVLSNIRDPPSLEMHETGGKGDKKGGGEHSSHGHHHGVGRGGDGPVAWSMLDVGRPIPATLKAIPPNLKALVLQFSPHKDILYVAIVSRGSLGAVAGNTKHPPRKSKQELEEEAALSKAAASSPPAKKGKGGKDKGGGPPAAAAAAPPVTTPMIDVAVDSIPVVSKYELPPGTWPKIVQLKRDAAKWRNELAKFLARDVKGDASGGDYYEPGMKADDVLNDMFEKNMKSSSVDFHDSHDTFAPPAPPPRNNNNNNDKNNDKDKISKENLEEQYGEKMSKALSRDELEYELLTICERMDELLGPALGTISDEIFETAKHLNDDSTHNSASSSKQPSRASSSHAKHRPGSSQGDSLKNNQILENVVTSAFIDQKPIHPIDTALDNLANKVYSYQESLKKHHKSHSHGGVTLNGDVRELKSYDGPGLILLADTELLDLPLEMLSAFRLRNLKPKSRDFSAHVLSNRLGLANPRWHASSLIDHEHGEIGSGDIMELVCENRDICAVVDPRNEDKLIKPPPASSRPSTSTNPPSTAPGAPGSVSSSSSASSSKKATTTAAAPKKGSGSRRSALESKNNKKQNDQDNAQTNETKEREPILIEIKNKDNSVIGSVASGWNTIVSGDDRVVGEGEWQTLLRERRHGGFVFYGPGNVLSHFSTSKLAGLDASGCRMVVLMDRMENEESYRRKLKLDSSSGKSVAELSLEQPVETAALWTLTGVGSVISNQWASSFSANSKVIARLFDSMVNKDMLIGAALTRATCPDDFESIEPPTDKKHASTPLHSTIAQAKARAMYNPVMYGIPTVSIKQPSDSSTH